MYRCHRLRKECRPSPTSRKRSKRSSAPRTARLEAKLDSIVSMLHTSGAARGSLVDWEMEKIREKPDATQSQVEASASARPPAGLPSPSTTDSPSNLSSSLDPYNAISVPPEVTEDFLRQFRSRNLRYLPFAYIPPHVTSQQLRRDRPFLWTCIMAVMTPEATERDLRFMKINELIYQKVLLENALSTDILLGVMTYVSW